MEQYKLRYFIRIAELGNITKAAESLSISQQALSKLVHQIEQEMGVPLLERKRDGVTLTDYGRQFMVYALAAVAQHDRLLKQLHSMQTSGREKVSFAYGTGMLSNSLPQLLIDFMEEHPDTDFYITSYSDDPYNRASMEEQPDLMLCSLPPLQDFWDVPAEYHLPIKVMMANSHPLTAKSVIHWADIADYPLIHLSIDNTMNRHLEQEYARRGIRPAFTINPAEQHMTAMLMDRFRALTFFTGKEGIAEQMPEWNAVIRPLVDCNIPMDYYLVVNRHANLSRTAHCLVEVLHKELDRIFPNR